MGCKVAVVCIETGKIYKTMTEAAQDAGCSKQAIDCAIQRGCCANGMHYRKAGQDAHQGAIIAILNKRTGELYNTQVDASKATGKSIQTIHNALTGEYKRPKFEYVEREYSKAFSAPNEENLAKKKQKKTDCQPPLDDMDGVNEYLSNTAKI